MANWGGATTRALGVDGEAGVRGAVKYSCVAREGVADFGGVVGEAGTDCRNGLVGATEARCSLDEAGVASDFAAATIFSADLLAAGAIGSTGIDVPAGPSTLRGLTGGGVGSARFVTIGGVAGLAGGQLPTPPACTVLHHGQRIGSVLAAVICLRSSRSSRCNASFCCEVWWASSSIRRRSFRCLQTAEMARTGVAKTNSPNNTARSSNGYPRMQRVLQA